MSVEQNKRLLMLLSIVEQEKGKKLIKQLGTADIRMHFQLVGMGTAPSEMMDMFGIGTNVKDIVISLAAESTVRRLMADFGNNFASYSKYGGLMMVLKMSAVNRLICETLHRDITPVDVEGANSAMKNEHHHQLIMITVNQGYYDQVMETAKRAGATGGTVVRGRLADTDAFLEFSQMDMEEEREIICILASSDTGRQIMEQVNREFGLNSDARGILCAVPVEKAYKI